MDLFSELGINGLEGFGGFGHHNQEPVGPDINLKIRISLEDAYNGKTVEIAHNKQALCPHCRGSGADSEHDLDTCPRCRGQGTIMRKKQLAPGFVQQFQEHCNKCNGEGKIIKKQCHVCHANKVMQAFEIFEADIDKGVDHGHVYVYEEAGDEYLNVKASPINIRVEIAPHKVFQREGEDLRTTVKISLKEALLGFSRTLKHLDGHEVKLNRVSTTRPGYTQKIIGEGMPHFNFNVERGDLYVKYEVEFPNKLSEEQKELFREFFSQE
mmetsp:Transcript_3712/g.3436  ORF Transcript_3712/g.3436 Transcript_3712/m.3436 type:complete len:268 (-) Transcript_3712:6-809(-)